MRIFLPSTWPTTRAVTVTAATVVSPSPPSEQHVGAEGLALVVRAAGRRARRSPSWTRYCLPPSCDDRVAHGAVRRNAGRSARDAAQCSHARSTVRRRSSACAHRSIAVVRAHRSRHRHVAPPRGRVAAARSASSSASALRRVRSAPRALRRLRGGSRPVRRRRPPRPRARARRGCAGDGLRARGRRGSVVVRAASPTCRLRCGRRACRAACASAAARRRSRRLARRRRRRLRLVLDPASGSGTWLRGRALPRGLPSVAATAAAVGLRVGAPRPRGDAAGAVSASGTSASPGVGRPASAATRRRPRRALRRPRPAPRRRPRRRPRPRPASSCVRGRRASRAACASCGRRRRRPSPGSAVVLGLGLDLGSSSST